MAFIALIDYEMGNLLSVSKALEFTGAEVRIVKAPAEAEKASGVLLPGVGSFGDGMFHLNRSGFTEFVKDWITADKPFLGICLGMQMLMESSEEYRGWEFSAERSGVFHPGRKRSPTSDGTQFIFMGMPGFWKGSATAPIFILCIPIMSKQKIPASRRRKQTTFCPSPPPSSGEIRRRRSFIRKRVKMRGSDSSKTS